MHDSDSRNRINRLRKALREAELADLRPDELLADRYEILEVAGRGGMAVVFRARDRKLDREVAIKMLREELAANAVAVSRMIREARAIASLHHPSILKLHDVCEQRPPYLVMELLKGRTLEEAFSDSSWPLDDRIRVLAEVAVAAHAAHEHGVVHRDLKPGNVLLEESGRVVVMDFGLAHLVDAETRLTRSGATLGTPAYMAPEQVRADAGGVDRRTDVYALGVMLYEALAGRTPHQAESAAKLYEKILREEAAPAIHPRSSAERDLQTICLKAMSKDPRDRYATALAFAEDLRRQRAGDPIVARPLPPWQRVARRLARRKKALVTLAAGLVLVAVSLGLWAALRRSESHLTRTHRSLIEQMRTTSEACLEAALALRRAGDLPGMRKQAANVEEICRKVSSELPRSAEPHYRWARMLRALMRNREALAELGKALARDPAYGPALYERIVLLAQDHQIRIRELEESAWKSEGAWLAEQGAGEIRPGMRRDLPSIKDLAARDPLARGLMNRLEEDLAALERDPRGLEAGPLACARGLRAWARGDPVARQRLSEAIAAAPDLEEGYSALAALEIIQERYEDAIRWLTSAIGHDRGYIPHRESRAHARANWALSKAREGEDAGPLYAAAVDDFDAAIALDPRRGEPWMRRGHARSNWGAWRASRGEESETLYGKALEDFGEAIRLEPARDESWLRRGHARVNWGLFKGSRGEDPGPLYGAAIGDFGEALKLDSGRDESWMARGLARLNWGFHRASRGEDPGELYREAIEDFGQALKRNPGRDEIWISRGLARVNWGFSEAGRGEDPGPLYEAAIQDFSEAIKLAPARDETWMRRAHARGMWGLSKAGRGEDPAKLYEAAMQDFAEAIQRNSARDETWMRRAHTRVNLGVHAQTRGLDPGPYYHAAIEDFDEAIRQNPSRDRTWTSRAVTRMNWGVYKANRGEDPGVVYEAAIEDFGEAIKRNRTYDQTWMGRAQTRVNWGFYQAGRNRDPGPLYEAAIEDFGEAIKRNPAGDGTWMRRGNARMNWGLSKAGRGEDPSALYEAALLDFDEGLRLNAARDETWMGRGQTRVNWGVYKEGRREEPIALYRAGVEDLDRALRNNPANAGVWWSRAYAWYRWALYKRSRNEPAAKEFRAALRDSEETKRLNPRLESSVRAIIDASRGYLESHPDER